MKFEVIYSFTVLRKQWPDDVSDTDVMTEEKTFEPLNTHNICGSKWRYVSFSHVCVIKKKEIWELNFVIRIYFLFLCLGSNKGS